MARAPSPYELHPKSRNKLDQVLEELRIAEHNCDIILQKAEDMIRLSLLFHDLRNPAAMIDPLRDLVRMLKDIYSFVRRDIRRADPTRVVEGRIAPENQQRPALGPGHFQRQQTLCPLVLLFRILARGLNAYRPHVTTSKNDWGPIRPLLTILESLQWNEEKPDRPMLKGIKIKGKRFPIFPGLTACIMFHEQEQVFTIASSKPVYFQLLGLSELARAVRDRHLAMLETQLAGCSPELHRQVATMRRHCDATTTNGYNPFTEDPSRVAAVAGTGATFAPNSKYMATCFLDHFRFVMDRVSGKGFSEPKDATKKAIFGTDSCAEWEFWIMNLSGAPRAAAAEEARRLIRQPPQVAVCTTFPVQAKKSQPAGGQQTWNSTGARVEHWDPPERHREEEESGCCCTVM